MKVSKPLADIALSKTFPKAADRLADPKHGGDGSNQFGAKEPIGALARPAVTLAQAAEEMDVSRQSVVRFRQIKDADDLKAKVESGNMSLTTAAEEAKELSVLSAKGHF